MDYKNTEGYKRLSEKEQKRIESINSQLEDEGLGEEIEEEQEQWMSELMSDRNLKSTIEAYIDSRSSRMGSLAAPDYFEHSKKAQSLANEYLKEHPEINADFDSVVGVVEELIRTIQERMDEEYKKQNKYTYDRFGKA